MDGAVSPIVQLLSYHREYYRIYSSADCTGRSTPVDRDCAVVMMVMCC